MMEEYHLPLEVERGIYLINRGEYYKAHEVLEFAWGQEKGNVRQLLQGLVQVSVMLYHLERDNQKGAQKLVLKALENIRPFEDMPSELEIPRLIDDLTNLAAQLNAGNTDEPVLLPDYPIRLHLRHTDSDAS